ncbi:hypothetical protein [Saccharopolyspora shandongensis]|uniref:hypothetical protein n=1 Tax=Saccharopolyspora shandongensis TaxID=418495 RepID=UPI0033C96BDC
MASEISGMVDAQSDEQFATAGTELDPAPLDQGGGFSEPDPTAPDALAFADAEGTAGSRL